MKHHFQSNSFLIILIFAAISALLSFSCSKPDDDTLVPKETTSFQISISGTTYQGNTNTPMPSTAFTPINDFQLTGSWLYRRVLQVIQETSP
jgi:hypothetical protein